MNNRGDVRIAGGTAVSPFVAGGSPASTSESRTCSWPHVKTESSFIDKCLKSQSQEGSILLLILAIVMVLSIGVSSIVAMTISSSKVATKLEESTAFAHTVDGAMEKLANTLRHDEAALCPGTVEMHNGIRAECTYPAVNPQTIDPGLPQGRRYEIQAVRDINDELVAKARIEVVDEMNGSPNVGYSVTVCDWLIGGIMLDQNPHGCPGDPYVAPNP